MIQSTSGSPWDLVMGWVCLVWLVLALWGRFRAARKRGTVVLAGGWYLKFFVFQFLVYLCVPVFIIHTK